MLHEKLACYRLAMEVAEELGRQVGAWPKGYGFLADQLRRASASVVLNLAEGNARRSRRERQWFFQVSRASAAEVMACVDLMCAYALIPAAGASGLKSRLALIGKMIHRLP